MTSDREQLLQAWRTHRDGGAFRALIEALGRDDLPQYASWALLWMFSAADTPTSREYLIARVTREKHDGPLMCAADSLGRLREPRGLPLVAHALGRKDWSVPVRRNIAQAMADMDAPAATEVFLRHLREPGADLLPEVVRALASIDPLLAQDEARGLLGDSRADGLDAKVRRHIRDAADLGPE